jgi:DNA-binding CsgD family transcriptional regulator
VRWAPDATRLTRLEAAIRGALGDDAYSVAYGEGRALALSDAVGWIRRGRGERKRPASGWDSLTPTELRVVALVAEGLTNPEIGERMFISRATVKVHLSHIFAKLDVATRSELAAETTRHALTAK